MARIRRQRTEEELYSLRCGIAAVPYQAAAFIAMISAEASKLGIPYGDPDAGETIHTPTAQFVTHLVYLW
jgi:hypothetical protein